MTKPLFILGPGRSGTASMARMLDQYEGIEAHHEYCNLFIQDIACWYGMGLWDLNPTITRLDKIYGAAVRYSDATMWIDASHKLSWLVKPLSSLFPTAKFLHINRHGAMVASEFFYKFRDRENTIYEDGPTDIMQRWLNLKEYGSHRNPTPPPDKRYRWKIPQTNQSSHEEFKTWNRFQRICYHWAESNRSALTALNELPHDQWVNVHLEDIVSHEETLQAAMDMMDVPYDHSMFEFLQVPRHVLEPVDYGLTSEQQRQFDEIAGPMMQRCGYAEMPMPTLEYLTKP